MNPVEIAIVGSGPAGLSAACRAAAMGDSHVLLEAEPHLANTIYRYQKGKHVMAEPAVLPLRASARFEIGRREVVLKTWNDDVAQRKVNVLPRSKVTDIRRDPRGFFELDVEGGEKVIARSVVLAIGMQGNVRKLGAPGEDLEHVQYQLDDPDEYRNEVIVVVGAGDAAIENAIALSAHNQVHIVNRKGEFSRAKDGNNAAILAAIDEGRIKCHYHAGIDRVVEGAKGHRMTLALNSRDGALDLACDRVIGRLGATPPREFLDRCGIKMTGTDPAAVPVISARYETSVPGLYVVGALAGNPLIKQAMNQGYEVVEIIRGRPVVAADEPLLQARFQALGGDVPSAIALLQERIALLKPLTTLKLREFMLESTLHSKKAGELIYETGTFGTSVFGIIEGEIGVQADPTGFLPMRILSAGKIFGEMALISGRPRSASVMATQDTVLIEIPRRAMLRLMAAEPAVMATIHRAFAERAIQTFIAPEAEDDMLADLVATATSCQFRADEVIFKAGDPATDIHLVRSGSVMIGTSAGEHQSVLAYIAAGQYFGEDDVIANTTRQEEARAAVKTETIRIGADAFRALLERHPSVREAVRQRFRDRIRQRHAMEKSPERGAMMHFLLGEGLGEATDALLIDETLCVGCDQCEKACAATHGNVSRLDREAGATFQGLHVPTSCRHCEHPHCMKDCPPDAIHRAPNGEVFIQDTCIGCGNCERNCPYGVIQMGVPNEDKPSLWKWLITGRGFAPGSDIHVKDKTVAKKAVKCDMCRGRAEGPACVQACPTGAAIRVGPEEYFNLIAHGR